MYCFYVLFLMIAFLLSWFRCFIGFQVQRERRKGGKCCSVCLVSPRDHCYRYRQWRHCHMKRTITSIHHSHRHSTIALPPHLNHTYEEKNESERLHLHPPSASALGVGLVPSPLSQRLGSLPAISARASLFPAAEPNDQGGGVAPDVADLVHELSTRSRAASSGVLRSLTISTWSPRTALIPSLTRTAKAYSPGALMSGSAVTPRHFWPTSPTDRVFVRIPKRSSPKAVA